MLMSRRLVVAKLSLVCYWQRSECPTVISPNILLLYCSTTRLGTAHPILFEMNTDWRCSVGFHFSCFLFVLWLVIGVWC